MIIKDIFIEGAVWSVHLFTLMRACVHAVLCAPVSPPPQQVEEDENNVEIEGEGSSDVFLWIQTIAHCPHQQLTVNHQEL